MTKEISLEIVHDKETGETRFSMTLDKELAKELVKTGHLEYSCDVQHSMGDHTFTNTKDHYDIKVKERLK